MSKTQLIALSAVVLATTLGLVTPVYAGEHSITFQVDEPIVIGDQIYMGGEVVLTHLRASNLVALRINNRHIGFLQNTGWGLRPAGSKPVLICERGDDGLLRFRHVLFRNVAEARTMAISFQTVALESGFSQLPSLRLPVPQAAIANR